MRSLGRKKAFDPMRYSKQNDSNDREDSCKFLSVISLVYVIAFFLNFYCYFTIDSSVGRHLCFDDHRTATNKAGQKTMPVTKYDITVTKSDINDDVIALIKAQVCDKYR